MSGRLTRESVLSMPAGPEMDALVAERVMGLIPCGRWQEWEDLGPTHGLRQTCDHGINRCFPDSAYLRTRCDPGGPSWDVSTEIASAWEVVDKLCGHEDADEDPFVLRRRYSTGAWLPGREHWTAEFLDGLLVGEDLSGAFRAEASAETAPLAICRAALLTTLEE